MMRITPATRISFGLVLLTVCVLLIGNMLGLTPDGSAAALRARQHFCESIAVQVSLAMRNDDQAMVNTILNTIVERNPEVISAALRRMDGSYVAATGAHREQWGTAPGNVSTPTHVQVPIFRDAQRWGTVEIHFAPLYADTLWGPLSQPFVQLVVFMAVVGFFVYLGLLKKSLKNLDPSAVIPARVKAALDILYEGVALVDEKGNVVLANNAFAAKAGSNPGQLLGRTLSELPWHEPKTGRPTRIFPWLNAMQEGKSCIGVPMQLRTPDGITRTLMVNGSPITDGKGVCRGALATFDDVTQLEMKNAQLEEMLHMLKDSQDKVHQQNYQLRVLASEDPLTSCLNRRALFERIEEEFALAQRQEISLCCVMCDIDHFKSINDRFGHGTGDRVIEAVAGALRTMTRDGDTIGRYGGEEFCVLLPKMSLPQAIEAAERLRAHIESIEVDGIRVTASFGLTSTEFGAADIQELLHQADTALYDAKGSGRNIVAVWGAAHTVTHATIHQA